MNEEREASEASISQRLGSWGESLEPSGLSESTLQKNGEHSG